MKYISFYEKKINCKNEDEVFNFLINTLKPSNTLWSFFINWQKVYENVRNFEVSLNILNYLIGKNNFDIEFKSLISENPQVIKTLPALLGIRGNKKMNILVDYSEKKLIYEDFDFDQNNISDINLNKYLSFVTNSGLKELIVSGKIKNLVDFMVGLESGLDTNGRKNRGGSAMEDITEAFIKDVCFKKNYKYLKEANAKKIKDEFNIEIPVDKSSRRYDYIIYDGKDITVIETNYYGGGGSKLKSTAGEYRNFYPVLNGKFRFIWITDGLGWNSSKLPLRETFNHNDYILNLSMLEQGILDNIL